MGHGTGEDAVDGGSGDEVAGGDRDVKDEATGALADEGPCDGVISAQAREAAAEDVGREAAAQRASDTSSTAVLQVAAPDAQDLLLAARIRRSMPPPLTLMPSGTCESAAQTSQLRITPQSAKRNLRELSCPESRLSSVDAVDPAAWQWKPKLAKLLRSQTLLRARRPPCRQHEQSAQTVQPRELPVDASAGQRHMQQQQEKHVQQQRHPYHHQSLVQPQQQETHRQAQAPTISTKSVWKAAMQIQRMFRAHLVRRDLRRADQHSQQEQRQPQRQQFQPEQSVERQQQETFHRHLRNQSRQLLCQRYHLQDQFPFSQRSLRPSEGSSEQSLHMAAQSSRVGSARSNCSQASHDMEWNSVAESTVGTRPA